MIWRMSVLDGAVQRKCFHRAYLLYFIDFLSCQAIWNLTIQKMILFTKENIYAISHSTFHNNLFAYN